MYLTAATSDLKPTCRDTRGATSSCAGAADGGTAEDGLGGGDVTGSGGTGPGSLTNDQFLKSVSFWRSWKIVCQGVLGVGPTMPRV